MRLQSTLAIAVICCTLLADRYSIAQEIVWVEAESLDDKGGWVVDQQFMDLMGSPYVLAHGLGEPVIDAKGSVTYTKFGFGQRTGLQLGEPQEPQANSKCW